MTTLYIAKVTFFNNWTISYDSTRVYGTSKEGLDKGLEKWYAQMEKIQGTDYFHRENCEIEIETTEIF